MPFGLVSGVGRGMGCVLDGVVIVEWEGAVLWVNLGRPIVTNGDGDALFQNYFGKDLLLLEKIVLLTLTATGSGGDCHDLDIKTWRI